MVSAKVETELDCASSAGVYFRPLSSCYALLNCFVQPLQTPAPALGSAVVPTSLVNGAHILWRLDRRVTALLRRTSVRDATRRVLGLGGPTHLNVSLTRSYTAIQDCSFQCLLLSFLYSETVRHRVLLHQTISTARIGRPLFQGRPKDADTACVSRALHLHRQAFASAFTLERHHRRRSPSQHHVEYQRLAGVKVDPTLHPRSACAR